jgi:hypothetical protein
VPGWLNAAGRLATGIALLYPLLPSRTLDRASSCCLPPG